MAAADGITHIVCTPHANGQYTFDPEINREKRDALQALLKSEGIPVTLGLGCDFHLSYDNIEDAKVHPAKYSIDGLGYLLVELPDYGLPRGLTEVFYELQVAGLTPILTHPERNATLQNDMARLESWLRGGLLVQVTSSSVLGRMGRTAEKMSHHLLSRRWVHFLATDAHNTSSRPPLLSEARDLVAKRYGTEYATFLCEDNPRAAYEGTQLPLQEEPHLSDDREEKGFFGRLMSRLGQR